MIGRIIKAAVWQPFSLYCRWSPIIPFVAAKISTVEGVTCIRIDNFVTRALGRLAGGYEYSVSYLVDDSLLIDTGFPWARRCLKRTLASMGSDKTITKVVNTHYHEDHTGNNDLLLEVASCEILAHPLALSEIRFPSNVAWYRSFLFGPVRGVEVKPIPDAIETDRFRFEVHHLPGHCPGHICLFEPKMRWLFAGDLYIAADLDAQLQDANGPEWIASLDRAIELEAECMFDAHGAIVTSASEVRRLLESKRDFLCALRDRIIREAEHAHSVRELTRRVFDKRTLVNTLSLGEGWLSLITGSDFSRSHLVKTFLQEQTQDSCHD